ncbi:hypothetical protein T4E_8598 [Trichinella pseudospiralis]|uniref:Protein kinase domain-containing protein n=1 Tax=Trichinella pseudospiralis TaxID=6337 RepID=A0A0V0YC45_TRIPS|nr:hypothetical protein T4E_8598 [Trichinella pseudospiralis]
MQNSVPNIVEINEVLAEGCFGAIVAAVNKETGQEVAWKVLLTIEYLNGNLEVQCARNRSSP